MRRVARTTGSDDFVDPAVRVATLKLGMPVLCDAATV